MASSFFDRKTGYDEMMNAFKAKPGESAVFVGFLRSSGVHKGTDLTVAQVGAIHEFGTKDGSIPERSYMRSSVAQNEKKIEQLTVKLADKVTLGKMGKKQALGILGQFVLQLFKSKIVAGLSPPLKKSTIQAKGSSKPLIDTGQLLNSLDWQVMGGKE